MEPRRELGPGSAATTESLWAKANVTFRRFGGGPGSAHGRPCRAHHGKGEPLIL
jgi:hypothetical protein